MDIISIQTANKVLKKMNTEYGGIYETHTATDGQTVFTSNQQCSIQGHVLHVYVDGFYSFEGVDYSLSKSSDGKAIVTFVKPLELGSQVLMSTSVVGIPKFEVINPPYDDTKITSDIATVKADVTSVQGSVANVNNDITTINQMLSEHTTDISNIRSALDDDADGSIVDTIANIKKQWQDADGNLQTLINDKASASDLSSLQIEVGTKAKQSDVTAIQTEVDAARGSSADLKTELARIENAIPTAYNDEALSERITTVEGEVSTLNGSVSSINNTLTNQSNAINELQTSVASIPAPYDDTSIKQRVSAIESKALTDFIISDTVTNYPYKISISNGVIGVELAYQLSLVTLSRTNSDDVHVGETAQFIAAATFSDNSDATGLTIFNYISSNESVATISSTGLLTAIAEGETTITLQGTTYGVNRQATMSITILPVPTP